MACLLFLGWAASVVGAVLPVQFELAGTSSGSVHSSPAIRRSDGWVFFGTRDFTGNSRVYAYSVIGSVVLKWAFPLPSETFSSPALSADGARLYIGDEGGTLHCLNATTGAELWSFLSRGAIRSSPAVVTNVAGGTETVWVTSDDGNLYGISSSGGQGQATMVASVGAGHASGNSPFTSSPVVAADGTVYVASLDGNFFAFSPLSSTPLWTLSPTGSGFVASPAIGPDGMIYVSDQAANLVAIDPITQNLKWPFPFVFPNSQSAEGQAVVARDGTIYVGNDDGNLYAIDPLGNFLWSVDCSNPIVASPALTSDGFAYVVTFAFFENDVLPLLVVNLSTHQIVNTSDPVTSSYVYDSSPAIGTNGMIFVGMLGDNDGGDDTGDVLAISPQTLNSKLALGFCPKFRSTNRNSGNVQDNRWTESPTPVATIIDLGTFDNGYDYGEGFAVNELDFVVGWSQNASINSFWQDAFLYNPNTGGMTDLYHMFSANTQTTGLGLNISNVVVGYQQNFCSGSPCSQMGFVWTQAGGMVELPGQGIGSCYAYGINRPGNIVGYSSKTGNWHAIFWPNSTTTFSDLGTLGGPFSFAYGVNDDGWVVGTAYTSSTVYHGYVVHEPGNVLSSGNDIGTMSSVSTDKSSAFAINGIGQIMGSSKSTDASMHVFLKNHLSAWNTGFQDLGAGNPGFGAINGRGQVVTDNVRIYVPYLGTTLQTLANYLSASDRASWSLQTAEGISSDGSVVGWGYHSGRQRAYMIQVK